VDGRNKAVSINGAKECRNTSCPGRSCCYTIRSRDVQTALAILVSGASILLFPTGKVLGSFPHIMRPSEVQQLLTIQDRENDEEFEETDSDQK
ncbi:hypothetical protein BGZ47_007949, partial [Haplosporangium gracile]